MTNLEKVRARYEVALHGVSLNLASADPLNSAYLKVWRELVDRIQPIRVSDHLCWTGIAGKNSHDLLPPPYTQATIDLVAEKISRAQDFLGRKILVENVSAYVEWKASEMGEADFLASIVRKTGCGLLLDLNNIYVSSKNLGGDSRDFLRALPLEAVEQLHLAGPSEHDDGFLVDTHDTDVRDEVWELYREWTSLRTRPTAVMIERDGNIPEWPILETELGKIAQIERDVRAAR
jgi:hypothetical protein